MSHGHDHTHSHLHPHSNDESLPTPPALDLEVADSDLSPTELGRRRFLRSAGVLGAGAAAVGVFGGGVAAADSPSAAVPKGGFRWLAGDHHIHTQFSPDGLYRVIDQVRHANAYGLDWMVVTDHGTDQHTRIGVENVNPDIVGARKSTPDTLVFQGLEWNIPAAEHGTVFVHPGKNEVSVLKQFELDYDGSGPAGTGTRGPASPQNEKLAQKGLHFLADAVSTKKVRDALMLANHPARRGVDSPHEIRGWRDAAPTVAIGMEGAPGHQAAAFPAAYGPGAGRGFYDNAPSASSFPGYPLESYRTFGGFDWMTSTVGGLWDSLLAEGKAWWISANSDSHSVYGDTAVRGDENFPTNGVYGDPVYSGKAPNFAAGDFWPGFYSRTHVGATSFSYAAVMAAMRAGRMWVDHGGLVDSVDVRLVGGGKQVPLGGVLQVKRGTSVSLSIRIRPAHGPNWSQFQPKLAKVDVVRGAVTGPVGASGADTLSAPGTKVAKTYDVSGQTNVIVLTYPLGRLDKGFYVRLRGSDGNRLGVGLGGAGVDPSGPVQDVVGDADPWKDLWFYTNPMWVLPT